MITLKNAIAVSFFLFAVSTLTSMAGMEIFSWVTFLLVMISAWRGRHDPARGFFRVGPDWALFGFLAVAVLSLLINGAPDANWSMAVGGQRWVFLVYMTAYAARETRASEKAFVPLLVVASVVCLHGIAESITGWDFIRHQIAFISDTGAARAAGFFSLPTRFASSFGMVFCFIVAALLLGLRKGEKARFVIWVAFVLVGAALVLSGTRGALLATLISIGVIVLLVSRRVFIAGATSVLIAMGALYIASPSFKARAQTLFDMKYESNADRLALWKLNIEIYRHSPLLGVGLDENERLKKEFAASYAMPVPHQGQAHNTYLQLAAGSGTLGLLCYLVIISIFFIYTLRLWRLPPPQSTWVRVLILGSLGAQLSLHLGGFVDCNFRASEVRHLFILVIGIISYLHFSIRPRELHS